LALATSLAAILNAGLLYRGLRKQGVFQPQLLLWWGSGTLSEWLNLGTFDRALHLFGWIIAAIVVYFVSLILFGLRLHHVSLK